MDFNLLKKTLNISKEYLSDLYINQGLSCRQMGLILNITPYYVKQYLNEYNIVRLINPNGKRTQEFKDRISNNKDRARKISEANKGKVWTEEHRIKISKALTGKPKSEIHRQHISENSPWKGKYREQAPNWQGGRNPLSNSIWGLPESTIWRNSVFGRDNYICQECGSKGNLEPHHIKEFSKILTEFLQLYAYLDPVKDKEKLLELAKTYKPFWEVSNGKTLCYTCHGKTYKKKVVEVCNA